MKCISYSLLAFFILSMSAAWAGSAQAQDLLGQINALRAERGLAPYTLDSALSAAAQNQANWMAQTGQVSHTQADGSTPRSRAAAAGYPSNWVSENIYLAAAPRQPGHSGSTRLSITPA